MSSNLGIVVVKASPQTRGHKRAPAFSGELPPLPLLVSELCLHIQSRAAFAHPYESMVGLSHVYLCQTPRILGGAVEAGGRVAAPHSMKFPNVTFSIEAFCPIALPWEQARGSPHPPLIHCGEVSVPPKQV